MNKQNKKGNALKSYSTYRKETWLVFFPNLTKIPKIYIKLPTITCEAERNYSKSWIIKSNFNQLWLRSHLSFYFLYKQYYKIIVIGKSDQRVWNKNCVNKEVYHVLHSLNQWAISPKFVRFMVSCQQFNICNFLWFLFSF